MFFDQELKSIQEHKDRLALCCDLRRCLVRIEVQGVGYGVRRTISNLTLGLAVVDQIFDFIKKCKDSRR